MSRLIIISLIAIQAIFACAQSKITPKGQELAKFLDCLQVEKKWLSSSEAIDWQTGEAAKAPEPGKANPASPDPVKDPKNSRPQPPIDKKLHTHCSSFVAAACAKLGIYLLRPPEHPAALLSNAQYDWLLDKGPEKGWNQILLPMEAQELANQGSIVIAVWKNTVPEKPGHIVIVRPCEKNDSQITAEGPDIIQAGVRNYNCTTLKEGFKNHKGAFDNSEILFFSHPPAAPEKK